MDGKQTYFFNSEFAPEQDNRLRVDNVIYGNINSIYANLEEMISVGN